MHHSKIRIKLQKPVKGVLNCSTLHVIFESQNRISHILCFKDPIPQVLASSVIYNFHYALCNELYYGECVTHFVIRSGQHIGISTLTNKRVYPKKDKAVYEYLLNWSYSASFEDFTGLCHGRKKYLLELKESLFVMPDRLSTRGSH